MWKAAEIFDVCGVNTFVDNDGINSFLFPVFLELKVVVSLDS